MLGDDGESGFWIDCVGDLLFRSDCDAVDIIGLSVAAEMCDCISPITAYLMLLSSRDRCRRMAASLRRPVSVVMTISKTIVEMFYSLKLSIKKWWRVDIWINDRKLDGFYTWTVLTDQLVQTMPLCDYFNLELSIFRSWTRSSGGVLINSPLLVESPSNLILSVKFRTIPLYHSLQQPLHWSRLASSLTPSLPDRLIYRI